ncbi:unnamed protein product [Cyprideis torosa]|uniref:ubiquitinyl hydrolase 1 n=1 Tax=Cyprideis torosa TaxID=163714 RepID=A0A7R8W227_9CRUS|nr:unnamed protein product [Cyprideis torosa]CAG0879350.1 unnamed protein product [Cyprideis torosa]
MVAHSVCRATAESPVVVDSLRMGAYQIEKKQLVESSCADECQVAGGAFGVQMSIQEEDSDGESEQEGGGERYSLPISSSTPIKTSRIPNGHPPSIGGGDGLMDISGISPSSTPPSSASSPAKKPNRKRLDSVTLCGVHTNTLQDFHQHFLEPRQDPFDIKYRLYAFVCHDGQLGCGHYTSYARSSSGKWLLYNDSSCKEIPESQLDPSSAYMLFYERQGLDKDRYMPPRPPDAEMLLREYEEERSDDNKCRLM